MRLPTPALLALLALAVAVLFGLGTWQVQRHDWKQGLVRERNARLAAPPLEAPAVLGLSTPEIEGHRVHLLGTWDHAHSMVLANRGRSGVKGEELVTPLMPAGGEAAILVNRGWYPVGERDRIRAALDAEPTAEVEGLAFDAAGRDGRKTAQGTWTELDPASMSAEVGVPLRDWAVVQGEPVDPDALPVSGGSLPVRGYRPFTNTTPHVQYAITWYGIAVALVAIAVARFVIAPRRANRAASREL
jgi:surfeit locus 1 family protein